MRTRSRSLQAALAAIFLGALAGEARAQAIPFTIDVAHSRIGFRARHLGLTWVEGRFRNFAGRFSFDSVNVQNTSAEATIQVASVFTDNERRDNDLRSANFFHADSFPEIRFVSRSVERGSAPGTYRMTGDLTIRGITRPVILDVEVTGWRVMNTRQGRSLVMGVAMTGRINRHDFGLRWNNVIEGVQVVGDEIRLDIVVEARAALTT